MDKRMISDWTVTWLMPVRNGMPYLPLTLEAIAGQSYRNHKIIVWDNGSTDGTLEELRRWIPARIPGRVVSTEPMRLGPSLAALTEMADTELCARIDADDISHPQRLARQVSFMHASPAVGLLGSQVELIDEQGYPRNEPGWIYPVADAELRWLTRWHAQFCHPSVLFRKSMVLKAGNYQDAQPFEDLDLAMRLAHMTEFANLPEKLLKYRRASTSSTGGVSEFLPLDRGAARKNVGILFPNIQDPKRCMELWEATHPHRGSVKSRVQHIWQLGRAATELAKALGKPSNYFTSTQAFQDQRYALKARAYRRVGLMPLVALKARAMHVGSSS
jgi:glycosyltransferase involved in cell wall biosynthesis